MVLRSKCKCNLESFFLEIRKIHVPLIAIENGVELGPNLKRACSHARFFFFCLKIIHDYKLFITKLNYYEIMNMKSFLSSIDPVTIVYSYTAGLSDASCGVGLR